MSSSFPSQGNAQQPKSELEAIGQRMVAALPGVRIWSLSLHDEHGDVLWLNESVMGPDEHEAVRSALEAFAGEGTPPRYEYDLGDGRTAVALRASGRGGLVRGLAMVVLDSKTLANRGAREPLDPLRGLLDPLDSLGQWLANDVSATQTRLRALPAYSGDGAEEPEVSAAEPAPLTLELAPEEPAQTAAPQSPAATAAAPTAPSPKTAPPGAAPAAPKPAQNVDPGLDRHFAALRALPLVLYTQQLAPMTPGSRIRRYEILLRTGSEHGRLAAPVAMLDAAVKRGLGSVIDRRVVTELITWLARHPDAWRTDPVLMSVNLSPSALVDDHFLKFLELCLAKSELPRGMIAFELDAVLCAQHLMRAEQLSQMFAAFGCSLIIDDFGLSESLLALLSFKGLRMLKLRSDLTANIAADKRRQAIVAGIAQTARVLGMHTCAKRIETRSDQRWLAALKVDFAQGFAFDEPKPLEALAGAATPAPE
jgi:EAL domain-containing protein (putative c-di-GMP-specific phosphodiesterase class I)